MRKRRTKAADGAATGAHGAHRATERPQGEPAAKVTALAPSGAHRRRGGGRGRARAAGAGPAGQGARPLRLAGYGRVSTAGQADNGISLEEQDRRIRQYSEAHGAALVAVEMDRGLSGRTTRRPGLQRVLDLLKRGDADGVVVARLDRLSRSLKDAADLFARAQVEGWQIHSLNENLDTGSPSGRFVCHVLAAMAQWEREMAGERTRAALAEIRRQGRRISGKPPLGSGFRDGRVIDVPAEQAVLRRLQRLQAEGLGAKAIATRMNEAKDYNPRTRRPWHHGTVRDILVRAAKS